MSKSRIQSKTVAVCCTLVALVLASAPRSAEAGDCPCCTCNLFVGANQTFPLSVDLKVNCVQIESGGKLLIEEGITLTLAGPEPSMVDGDIVLTGSASKLKFECSDHTVTGSGKIKGRDNAANIEVASGVTFTNNAKITGQLQITGAGNFVNNRQVGAKADEVVSGTLVISVWGTIEDSVSATWNVTSSQATLRFGVSVCLKGGFTVSAGTLRAGADDPFDDIDVVTQGDLTHTGGAIVAGTNDSFTFNGTCP